MNTYKKYFIRLTLLTTLVLNALSSVSSASASYSTKTLFKFYRTNYKPSKVLHYDVITTDRCEFANKIFDPYYLETSTGERIDLNSDSYFIPKDVEVISNNYVRFKFDALEKLIGEDGYLETYIFPSNNQKQSRCKVFGIIRLGNELLKIEEIFAKMRVVLGRPIGLRRAEALARRVTGSSKQGTPFEISDKSIMLCLYGKECSDEHKGQYEKDVEED